MDKQFDYDRYWYKDIPEILTIRGMLEDSVRKFPGNPAFWVKEKKGAPYQPISYTLLQRDVRALGTRFMEMGLSGRRIAVMGQGCYEWIVSYLAVVCGVGVVVPIDRELSGKEVANLMQTAECDTLCCTRAEVKKLKGIAQVRNLIVMDFYGDRTDPDRQPVPAEIDTEKYAALIGTDDIKIFSWRQLLLDGEGLMDCGDESFQNTETDPDGLAVILFTSGTTGNPKGVMLSNRNITSNIMDVCRIAHILPSDKTLSLLPIHHTYECTLGMLLVLYRGASTAFCEGMKYITKNMKEAGNTVIIVVPRVLELIYGRIEKNIRSSGKEKDFQRLLKVNRRLRKMGINVSRRLFKAVLDGLGGRLRVVVTGAAALSPNICRMFEDFGVVVLQGYGMTECTPLIAGTPMSASAERYRKAGSVGVPVSTGEVRIVDKDESGIGEVCYRGPNVMLGYYNMPEETAAVMEPDGWMHTGDLGFLDREGWLYLTGRKKNIIVTKTGENVYPAEIEELVNASPYVVESMVFPYREHRDELEEEIVGVQVLPDLECIRDELGREPDEEEVREIIQKEISNINDQLAVYKRMRFVYVRKEDFVRTTTRKIRRMDNMM